MKISKFLFRILIVSLGLYMAPSVWAADISTGEYCSLADAILSAESDTAISGCSSGQGADTIRLSQDENITSIPPGDFPDGQNAFKTITSTISILGYNHTVSLQNNTAISGRVFNVIAGGNLTISDVFFIDLNSTATSMENGGFIFAEDSRVKLTNVSIDGFRATSFGGAIYSANSSIDLVKTIFSDNQITSDGFILGGGAIFLDAGSLKIQNSKFIGNISGGQGGAILNIAGFEDFIISRSLFADNVADYGSAISAGSASFNDSLAIDLTQFENNTSNNGGAFVWRGASGNISISSSTFTKNNGLSSAAAFQNDGGNNFVAIINSTFSQNISAGAGSAILNIGNNNQFRIAYDTFIKNTAGVGGRTFRSFSIEPWNNSVLENSIFDKNIGGDCGFVSVTNFTKTNNLSGDATCGDLVATNISMNSALNGGVVLNNALLAGSNAIDKAVTDVSLVRVPCPGLDQRGVMRPLDGNADGFVKCDIGAFEYKPKHTTLVSTVKNALKTQVK